MESLSTEGNIEEHGLTSSGKITEGRLTEGKINPVKNILYKTEEYLCIAAMSLMALLPLIEIFVQVVLKTGILGSSTFIAWMLLFTGLLTGMICTRQEEHLAVSFVQYIPEGKLKKRLKTFSCLLSAFVSTVLAWSSVSFVKIGLNAKFFGYMTQIMALIIPIAYYIIAVRFARRAGLQGPKIIFAFLVIILGTIASFPEIIKIIWGANWEDIKTFFIDSEGNQLFLWDITEIYLDYLWLIRIPVVILLVIAALAGTPLFVVFGGLALFLLFTAGRQMSGVASDIYSSLTNNNIIAIPLFALVGFFLSESKAGERLVNVFRNFFGWIPGGIIIVTVVICAFFTSLTGASGVTILALGGILYTILSEHLGYSKKFSIGLLTSAGSIGLLFPPSLPLILVGTVMMIDIRQLFLGGIIPGFILVGAVIVFSIIASRRVKIPKEKFEAGRAFSSLKEAAFEILLPVILLTGYFTGIFDITVLGAAAVLYVFIVEVLIKRDIKLKDVKNVFMKAIPIIGGVLSILAVSKAFSSYIVETQAPVNVAHWLYDNLSSKIIFLLLLNLILIIFGFFLDIFSAILIVLPLIIPLGEIYGINPIHLGIIFVINLEMGYLTPPVGLNLFLASYRFKESIIDICRYVFPFLIVRIAVVLLVTYIPAFSTWLVTLFVK